MTADRDEYWMEQALAQAALAAALGEVPVGAVLVGPGGELWAQEHNQTITLCDPSAHAEMLALRAATRAVGNYRLTGSTLYVSLEPCPMCAGALVWARVARVVFAAADPKAGALGSILDLSRQPGLNHHFQVQGGLLASASAQLLGDFFSERRRPGQGRIQG